MKTILFLISCTLVYTVTANEANEACAELGKGFHVKPSSGCKYYYSCTDDGTGMEYECPVGYLFNNEDKVCDKEGTFECDSDPLPVCPEEGVSQMLVKGSGCKKYLLCVEGQDYEQSCGEGLLFDENINKCDIAEKVECYECPEKDDPSNLIYYADKKNCAGYYICLKGKPEPFSCVDGLHYQENIKKCNDIESAECKYNDYTTVAPPTTEESTEVPTTLQFDEEI